MEKTKNKIMVSVLMFVYNHERMRLRQSVMQKRRHPQIISVLHFSGWMKMMSLFLTKKEPD